MTLLGGIDKQRFASDRIPFPVDVVADTAYVQSISGETVQFYYYNAGALTQDAGQAAGTLIVAKLAYTGVLDALGAMIGTDEDTSLSWTTGTALTTLKPCPKGAFENPDYRKLEEVAKDLTAGFTNGQYCLDHRSGLIIGIKATTGASDTAAYKVMTSTTGGGTSVTESVNLAKIAGTAASVTSGNLDNGTLRVAIATNDVLTAAIKTDVDKIPSKGTAIMTGSTPVTIATDDTQVTAIKNSVAVGTTLTGGSKTVTTGGTAEALGASLACKSVYVRAKGANTNNVYVGDSAVDKTTSQQIILDANDSVIIDVANRATVYVDVDTNGEGVDYLILS